MKPATRLLVCMFVLVTACAERTGSSTTVSEATTTTEAAPSTTTSASTTTSTTAPTTTSTTVTTTTVAIQAPEGFEMRGGPDVGFVIALPEGFVPLDLSSDDLDSLLTASQLDDDAIAAARAAIEMGTFRFWAFDFSHASDTFVPNVNAQAIPRTGFDDVDVYLEVLPQQYESLGATMLSIDQVEFDFGPAVTAVAQFPIGDGTSSTTYQLLAPVDDLIYTITISYLEPTDLQTTQATTALSTFQPLR
jgi:hypothetical protein